MKLYRVSTHPQQSLHIEYKRFLSTSMMLPQLHNNHFLDQCRKHYELQPTSSQLSQKSYLFQRESLQLTEQQLITHALNQTQVLLSCHLLHQQLSQGKLEPQSEQYKLLQKLQQFQALHVKASYMLLHEKAQNQVHW